MNVFTQINKMLLLCLLAGLLSVPARAVIIQPETAAIAVRA